MRFAFIVSILASLSLAHPPDHCRTQRVIRDGGFESGTTPSASRANPWFVSDYIGSATYALTSPGSTTNGGRYAFTASLYPGPYSDGRSGLTLSQTMKTCTGQNYSILAEYRFEYGADNNCAVTIEYPYKDIRGSVTTPSAVSPPGQWSFTGSTFQAVSSADPFKILFRCSSGVSNKISVDNVKIEPYAGNAF